MIKLEELKQVGVSPPGKGWLGRPFRRLFWHFAKPYFRYLAASEVRSGEKVISGISVAEQAARTPAVDAVSEAESSARKMIHSAIGGYQKDLLAIGHRLSSLEITSAVANESAHSIHTMEPRLSMMDARLNTVDPRLSNIEARLTNMDARLSELASTKNSPTYLEMKYMRGVWSYWFSKDPVGFAKAYTGNRAIISTIHAWLPMDALDKSLWRYGVPNEWDHRYSDATDRTGLPDVQTEFTVADLLAYIGFCLVDVRYLEIGVSAGKTFLPMCHQFPSGMIVGLDIEELNPVLASQFDEMEVTWKATTSYEVKTGSGFLANKYASMTKLARKDTTAEVLYLSADEFREETWQKLAGKHFNLIFSDSVHNYSTIKAEVDFLLKYDLIDRTRFAIVWDDLVGYDMQAAFEDNAEKLSSLFDKEACAISMHVLHGSYGLPRPVGVFASFRR